MAKLDKDPRFQKDALRLTGITNIELITGEEAQRFAREITELIAADTEAFAYLESKSK